MSSPPQLVTTAPLPSRALRAFTDLQGRDLNFTPIGWERAAADPAWRADRRQIPLRFEDPGPPQPGGTFEVARELLRTYEVADPALVRAVYDATSPLEGRTMLLIGRFAGLRFPMGVRIGGVVDGPDTEDGQPVYRFAWHYRTLEGHLERGQMDYEVVKHLDDGRVTFSMAAYSQREPDQHPIVCLGMLLFGRRTQLRFYARAAQRMRTLTEARAAPA